MDKKAMIEKRYDFQTNKFEDEDEGIWLFEGDDINFWTLNIPLMEWAENVINFYATLEEFLTHLE